VGLPQPVSARWRELAHRIYLYSVGSLTLGALGPHRSVCLAGWLGRSLYDINRVARARLDAALRRTYGATLSEPQRQAIARDAFANAAQFWAEIALSGRFLTPTAWPHYVRVAEPPLWADVARSARPALLVTAQLGNPAVGAFVLGETLRPVHCVVDPMSTAVLERAGWTSRRRPDVRLVPQARAARDLPPILDRGGKVIIIGDRPRLSGPAVEAPFLGRTLCAYRTVGVLAARHHARVVVWTCTRHRSRPLAFTIRCESMIDPPPGAVEQTTRRYLAALEVAIHAAPEQYRWTAPPTERA
jgi:lauroyl/myristoyl acyltransferase